MRRWILALMALLVNLRHVLMGASLSGKIAHFGRWRYLAAFLLTDESWALSERRAIDKPISRTFYFTVALTMFFFWQTASVASGVTSRAAGPVPPVVTTRLHPS